MVFGSFQSRGNAEGWARAVRAQLPDVDVGVQQIERDSRTWYRVVSSELDTEQYVALGNRARRINLDHWRVRVAKAPPVAPAVTHRPVAQTPGLRIETPVVVDRSTEIDAYVAAQTRTYVQEGAYGQDRIHPSLALSVEFFHAWNDGLSSVTFSPFLRLDGQDSNRTHADIRELFYTTVHDRWDLHVGFRRVFWGVTEFSHLVDIINQTDLVENLDGEDKLGQPMVQLSRVGRWGTLDAFVLPGFRPRTYPGEDGRLRLGLPISDDPTYASGARNRRTDVAVRWSHTVGMAEFGLYHFSGTGREPILVGLDTADGPILQPHYTTIDQTGIDAQAIAGDWIGKLEAMTRSGFGERYFAATVGLERTFVGVAGTRADLGLVAEYMYDERGEAATTVLEHDVAFGARWQQNDMFDTQALLGLIWDPQTREYLLTLEASRRLGDLWTLNLEGRAFAGGTATTGAQPVTIADSLPGADNKTGPWQRDDHIQFELTRYF